VTPALALAAVLRLRHGAIPQAATLCRALLPPPERDVVAVMRPGSRLEHQLRASVPADRLFCLGVPPDNAIQPRVLRPPALGEWTVVAGDADVDTPPGAKLPWPHQATPGWRLRRLDTLFPAHRRIGLIVTDDPARAPDLLRGAAAILAAAAPPVVIDLSALPVKDRLAAWSACASAVADTGYAWHDGMLMPCDVDATVVMTLRDAAVCAMAGHPQDLVTQLALLGWAAPVGAAPRIESPSVTDFDDDLPCLGFHASESNGHSVWRWSGAGPVCAFALRLPGPGTWSIVLEIADWGVVGDRQDLSLYADGVRLACRSNEAGCIRFGDLVVAPDGDDGRLIIELTTPRPRRRRADDPRPAGIAVRRATLERAA